MKERICITVDNDVLNKAKEHKVNVSMIAQMALERELELFTHNAYTKALENQVDLFKNFLTDKKLWQDFEEFKYKNVL